MSWLKDCEICNVGLCKAIDARKEKGMSERAASREMSGESEGLYSEDAILARYRYYTGKTKACEFHTDKHIKDEQKRMMLRRGKGIPRPKIPDDWDYDESVKRVTGLLSKRDDLFQILTKQIASCEDIKVLSDVRDDFHDVLIQQVAFLRQTPGMRAKLRKTWAELIDEK